MSLGWWQVPLPNETACPHKVDKVLMIFHFSLKKCIKLACQLG